MNILKTLLSSACLSLLLASQAVASEATTPHRFQGGLPALASQVNENFEELEGAIDDNYQLIQGLRLDLDNIELTPGPAGAQGPQGAMGLTGAPGLQGLAGPTGPQGSIGPMGADGIEGPPGLDGAPGQQGPQGSTGATGPTGPQGAQGLQGEPGLNVGDYKIAPVIGYISSPEFTADIPLHSLDVLLSRDLSQVSINNIELVVADGVNNISLYDYMFRTAINSPLTIQYIDPETEQIGTTITLESFQVLRVESVGTRDFAEPPTIKLSLSFPGLLLAANNAVPCRSDLFVSKASITSEPVSERGYEGWVPIKSYNTGLVSKSNVSTPGFYVEQSEPFMFTPLFVNECIYNEVRSSPHDITIIADHSPRFITEYTLRSAENSLLHIKSNGLGKLDVTIGYYLDAIEIRTTGFDSSGRPVNPTVSGYDFISRSRI